MTPELSLIRDALNRVARTALQQFAVLLMEALTFIAAQPDLTDIEAWHLGLMIVVHGMLSLVTAFVHRTVVDPSRIPSATPPATPRFAGPPPVPAPYVNE
jgi:hypothetical protein